MTHPTLRAWTHTFTAPVIAGFTLLALNSLTADAAPSRQGPQSDVQASANLLPFSVSFTFDYAVSSAISGDTTIVGDYSLESATDLAGGAAFITRFNPDNGRWVGQALLVPADVAHGDQFGCAVAIDSAAGVAVVGARWDDNPALNSGSAYVYRRTAAGWVFEQKLTPSDGAMQDWFGSAVAIDGSVIIVGSPRDDDNGDGSGSAYVFRHTGATWIQQQKLHASDASASDAFGSAIAMERGTAVIGAHFAPPSNSGAAYIFNEGDVMWFEAQKILPLEASALAGFGTAVDLRGDVIVVGAPRNEPAGSADVFRRADGTWTFEQRLVGAGAASDSEFGSPVAVDDGTIAVGAPNEAPPGLFGSGSVYRFTHAEGFWSQQQELRACAPANSQGFGHAVSVSSGRLLVSMYRPVAFGSNSALIFENPFPDCDNSAISDVCEVTDATDRNGNNVLDSCDIASQSSADCDRNGVPDEAEATVNYRLDNMDPFFVLGGGSDAYTLWLNQYNVAPAAETITTVSLIWAWDSDGLPATILLYDDPNNDGDPNDAVLLTSVNTFIMRRTAFPLHPTTFVRVPPTFVGDVGDSFFVGAIVNAPPGQTLHPAGVELTPPIQRRSWWAHGPAGSAVISNLALNPHPLVVYPNGDFILRASASDCNGNGVWDACDISDGISLDANANRIPDECEAALCPGDTDNSGAVDVDDLIAIILAWGQCPLPPATCPADVNDSGAVDVDDLLAVISSWGACP